MKEKGAEYSPAQTLCRAQEKDAALCAHIQRQSWRTAFHAMAFWGPSRDEGTQGWAELICIHGLPDNWGRGYGGPLLEKVLAQAKSAGYKKIMLWVFEENVCACRFYTKHGFAPTGLRRSYCTAPEIQYAREL